MGRSGRWLIVDFLYTWSFSQGTLFVIAAVLGARDTGVYRAMHDMFGPLRLLNLSIVTVLLPAGASAFNRAGRERLRQTTDRATRWVVIGAAAYCGALAVAGVPIVRTIYGKAYGHEILPMLFIALGYFMITTQLPMVVALKASFRARDVGMGRIVLVPLVAMSFPALAGGLGLLGAASAFLLCATASRTVIRRQYLRMLDDVEPPTRVSEHPAPVTDLSRIALEAR